MVKKNSKINYNTLNLSITDFYCDLNKTLTSINETDEIISLQLETEMQRIEIILTMFERKIFHSKLIVSITKLYHIVL